MKKQEKEYQAPRVESVLSSEQLDREVLYAGSGPSQPGTTGDDPPPHDTECIGLPNDGLDNGDDDG